MVHSSSNLIEERNGWSAGNVMCEGHKGEDGGCGAPPLTFRSFQKSLSSFETSRWPLSSGEAKDGSEKYQESEKC